MILLSNSEEKLNETIAEFLKQGEELGLIININKTKKTHLLSGKSNRNTSKRWDNQKDERGDVFGAAN